MVCFHKETCQILLKCVYASHMPVGCSSLVRVHLFTFLCIIHLEGLTNPLCGLIVAGYLDIFNRYLAVVLALALQLYVLLYMILWIEFLKCLEQDSKLFLNITLAVSHHRMMKRHCFIMSCNN